MARALNRRDIAALPLQQRGSVEASLMSGDLLFTSSRGSLSGWVVQTGCRSPWNHVGVLVDGGAAGWQVLESVPTFGVRFCPLSFYTRQPERGLPSFRGQTVIARHEWVEARPPSFDLLAVTGAYLARRYSPFEAAAIVVRELFGLTRRKPDDTYICSELVHECFLRGGYQLPSNPKGYITPADIWRDPHLHPFARIA